MEIFDKIKEWESACLRHVYNPTGKLIEHFKDKKDLVIIDVGANSGTFFDQLLNSLDIKQAVLFEPQIDLYNYLKEKYKDNPKITVENLALSDTVRPYKLDDHAFEAHIKYTDSTAMNLGLSRIDYHTSTSDEKLCTEYFDNISSRYNLDKIDIIKIDTETEDLEVLTGFTQTVCSLKEKPLIEFENNWWTKHSYEEAKLLLDTFCERTGYFNDVNLNQSGGDFYLYPPIINETVIQQEGYMEHNVEIELLKEYLAKINKLDEFQKFASRKNKPQLKDVTIVTGLWDLKRNDLSGWAHRSFETYKENFFKLLKADIPMCIYISKELEAEVRSIRSKHNTRVYIKDAEEFKTYFPFFDKLQEIRTSEEWLARASWLPDSPQAKLELYNPMVMTKAFMVNDAAILNPFNTKHFYWIDGGLAATVSPGYFEDGDVFRNIPTAYEDSIVHLAFPYDPHTEVHGFERKEFYKQCDVKDGDTLEISRGGFWGGPKELIHKFNSEYYTTLASTIEQGYVGTEECIYTILAYKFPEMVERFKISGDGLVWPFFEAMTNVTEFIKNKPKRPVTATTAKTNLYVLGFNSPGQFEKLCKSIEKNSPELLAKTRKILINNSTDTTLFEQYDELCKLFNFEEIHFENNIGICGGRQYVAEHFHESDADFYIFLEDDLVMNEETQEMCKTGFRQHVPNLYDSAVRIMLKDKFDYLKLCFSEFYSSNNVQCSWYNVPQSVRTKVWPHYNKLPEIGFDPNCPLTEFKTIGTLNGLAYATGQVYYSNWPMIVSRDGNYKMFIENKFSHPFEQTWMSQMFQDTVEGKLNPAIILATPFVHERTEFYKDGQRKEN